MALKHVKRPYHSCKSDVVNEYRMRCCSWDLIKSRLLHENILGVRESNEWIPGGSWEAFQNPVSFQDSVSQGTWWLDQTSWETGLLVHVVVYREGLLVTVGQKQWKVKAVGKVWAKPGPSPKESLQSCCEKLGLRTNSIIFAWVLVRNSESQAASQTYWLRIWFSHSLQGICAHHKWAALV